MTKSEMDLWDTGMIGPALLIINQYFDCVISEYMVLWASLVSQAYSFYCFLNSPVTLKWVKAIKTNMTIKGSKVVVI